MAKLKRWLNNFFLIFCGLIFAVLILEIGLRIVGFSYPSFYTIDEFTGATLRPGAAAWWREEGEVFIRINSEGLRDREHSKIKPAGTMRIAVLGDSFTEAKQVPLENTFWAVMEEELRSCEALEGHEVEAINFGVSGYGTGEELMTLRHRAWDYDPDIVVLAFYAGNDIRENSRTLQQNPLSPYFVYHQGQLVPDMSFRESVDYQAKQTLFARLNYQLINSSRVLQLANQAKNTLLAYRKAQARAQAPHDDSREPGLDKTIYLEPTEPAWIEAWQVTEGVIKLMRDEVVEKGAEFLVVTLSTSIQVHPDPSVRQQFMASLGIDNLFYPDLRIQALGQRENFSVLNLAQPLQARAEEQHLFFHGFKNTKMGYGHWNSEGHQLAGQMIAQKVCELIKN